MDTLAASVSLPIRQQLASYDDLSMQESILLDDSVKDLKNLRTQLYSAAEYFELSYTNDDQKHVVVETLKDYAIKALVNTVDHLGTVMYNVDDVIGEKVEEVSGTEFLVSCIEQRFKTCREYTGREGLAQQSSIIDAPRFHKRYILPAGEAFKGINLANFKYNGSTLEDENDGRQSRSVGEAIKGINRTNFKYNGSTLEDENGGHQSRNAACTIITDNPSSSSSRKDCFVSHSLRTSRQLETSTSAPKKEQDRRSVAPRRLPLQRSGSLIIRPRTPKPSRPTTPNPAIERQEWLPSRACKSASVRIHDERQSQKEIQQQPSKSKRLFKSLLGRRKSKRDDMLYTYLDEY